MLITVRSYQTIDGSQLKVTFSADFDGVDPSEINSITATFSDSAGEEISSFDVTGESEARLNMTKDQSIHVIITYTTDSAEYEGIANIATTRFAVKKMSDLVGINKWRSSNRITDILATVEPLLQDAVFVHSTGEREQFDRDIADINKMLDYYLPC